MMLLNELAASFFGSPLPQKTIFRLDGGQAPRLAYGHLVRCHLLSQWLRRQGKQTSMLMRREPDGMAWAKARGEILVEDTSIKTLTQHDALVMDLPFGPEQAIMEKARRNGARLCSIDDGGQEMGWCDVVLNSSVLANPSWYPGAKRHLLGPDYFIMDDQWAGAAWNGSGQSSLRVTLTFGGADPIQLTPQVVAAIDEMDLNIDKHVVLGPGYAGPNEFPGWTIHRAPRELLPLLMATDLLICSGGRTVYEGHFLGVPTMCIGSTDVEGRVAQEFVNQGLNRYGLTAWDKQHFQHQFSMATDTPDKANTTNE